MNNKPIPAGYRRPVLGELFPKNEDTLCWLGIWKQSLVDFEGQATEECDLDDWCFRTTDQPHSFPPVNDRLCKFYAEGLLQPLESIIEVLDIQGKPSFVASLQEIKQIVQHYIQHVNK